MGSNRIYAVVNGVIIEIVPPNVLIGIEEYEGDVPRRDQMKQITPAQARMLAAYLIDAAEAGETQS